MAQQRQRQKLVAPLPVRDGVGPSFLWIPEGRWDSLRHLLLEHFSEIEPAAWDARLAKGEVVDQHGTPLSAGSKVARGMCIFYYRDAGPETPIPFEEQILYRDEHVVVVDKPHFLPVTPAGRFVQETLLVRLRRKFGWEELVPLHRLDRETAGIMLFSHNPATRGTYQALFRERAMEKVYEALAPWRGDLQFPLVRKSRIVPGTPFFRMREEVGEPNAETGVEIIERRGNHALYRLEPISGKQHQLRVHMAALGMPILNDDFYPNALPCKGDDFSRPLQLLARRLAFDDPLTGERRVFISGRNLEGMT
jgi:tRNA pseudouridine32 synthase/23S rRNA pseudouridine746 synthase